MKNLQLSLKKKWFDMTASGEKTEDYREITPYWEKRLYNCQIECTKSKFYGDCQEFINNKIVNSFPCHKCEYSELKQFTHNTMTLGYPSKNDTSKTLTYKHAGIHIGEGKPEWVAEKGKLYFVIKHGERVV